MPDGLSLDQLRIFLAAVDEGSFSAAAADIVLIALRWADAAGVMAGLPDWNGRIVIDATNPVLFL